jgi:soluble cytochrome b562
MSLAINSSTSGIEAYPSPRNTERTGEHRQAKAALSTALDSGDLEAAKTAFADLAALSSPDRASKHPDGPFAQLQKALASGDVDAAKTAFATLQANQAARKAAREDNPPLDNAALPAGTSIHFTA